MRNVVVHDIAKLIPQQKEICDDISNPYIFVPSKNIKISYIASEIEVPRNYYRDKFLVDKENDIHRISIFDVDWEYNREKISMYFRSLFLPQTKLMARKCILERLDNNLACEFVDKYHIQGSNKQAMKINYGLYYNKELVSVISFGKLRLKTTEEGQYELHRYCVKDGYSITGGIHKLFMAFESEYNPKYILSYSDNDVFLGGVYGRLGFTNSGQSVPRYYWYLWGREVKRERCQLKRLRIDYPRLLAEAFECGASNKEIYVMHRLGATQVWRSGNTKWEKIY